MIGDTISAWRTGQFEGISVFRAEDPGGPTLVKSRSAKIKLERTAGVPSDDASPLEAEEPQVRDSGQAGIRIDLSRIGVR